MTKFNYIFKTLLGCCLFCYEVCSLSNSSGFLCREICCCCSSDHWGTSDDVMCSTLLKTGSLQQRYEQFLLKLESLLKWALLTKTAWTKGVNLNELYWKARGWTVLMKSQASTERLHLNTGCEQRTKQNDRIKWKDWVHSTDSNSFIDSPVSTTHSPVTAVRMWVRLLLNLYNNDIWSMIVTAPECYNQRSSFHVIELIWNQPDHQPKTMFS